MKQPLQVLYIHVKSALHSKSSDRKQEILTSKADTDTKLSPHDNLWYHSTAPQYFVCVLLVIGALNR